MKNADKPINPSINSIENGEGNLCAVFTESGNTGLTKREYFAGLAMQALISNPNIKRPIQAYLDNGKESRDFSKVAIEYADSLLKCLEEKEEK